MVVMKEVCVLLCCVGEGDEFTMTDITGVLDSALGEMGAKEPVQG